jgi:hypothetical protein
MLYLIANQTWKSPPEWHPCGLFGDENTYSLICASRHTAQSVSDDGLAGRLKQLARLPHSYLCCTAFLP